MFISFSTNLTAVTDAAGRIKTIAYMATGAVASVLDEDVSGYTYEYNYSQDTQLYYARILDTNGTVKEVWIDANGETWTYTYDNSGRLRTVTDPLLNVTEYTYDPVGNRKQVIDPEEKVTQYEYDPRDNLEKMINPELEETRIESTFDGRVLKQTDGENRTTRYEYDPDGRLAKTIDGNANEIAMGYESTASGCSSCGGGGSSSQPSVITFPTFTRHIKYDLRGRKSAQRDLNDVEEHVTRFAYDSAGNLIEKTDAEGKVTAYEYDRLNRLAKVIDADLKETLYTYDNRDNLIALTDAENQTTRFEYDRNNRLVKEIRPMGEETRYGYDDEGHLIEKIDPKNQRAEYLYDDAGRLETIRYYEAGDHVNAVKSVAFTYDKTGNLTGYDDGTTSAVYTYDDAYRKIGETVTYPGFSLTSAYTYYKNGLKKTYTGPDGIAYGFLYDGNNQLTGIQIPDVGMFTVNDYKWNRPSAETLPGGAKRLYDYDDLMRVSGITAKDPAGNDQLHYNYTYDKVDNITEKATGSGDYAYTYDDLYRLTDADNPEGQADEAFTYDGVGNRLTDADTAGDWSYNDNNELEGYDDAAFQYDANGNMTEKSVGGVVTRFFYNTEDRLERVEDGSGSIIATYYYDPFGRRLWKDVGGARTCFHYSDEGLAGEYDGAGVEIKIYGWKPGSTWSTDPVFMKQAGQYYWYQNDHLGTPQAMTASSGAVVWSAKYTTYGNAAIAVASTSINNLRFAGQYFDHETGLHYNYHRYYDPSLGRHLRPDPSHSKQASESFVPYILPQIIYSPNELNLYAYVSGNPLRYFDAKGLCNMAYVKCFEKATNHRVLCGIRGEIICRWACKRFKVRGTVIDKVCREICLGAYHGACRKQYLKELRKCKEKHCNDCEPYNIL